ncbi:Serine phosphatase RsbU, regulator of sigma subunit [Modestobacter sp. DSM 44400]|uniref:SpoIIE family protein phosphatase n=1 Tax=Modestobacter sp. DSM 44400 TaxID=1550230 RepID=UPI00089CD9A5|nr:SpoIIE family protein phosphatase [Modestobacter sp. DSM 44400]SDY18395.1 Serine phosphatase RsbU, regulator of sigma subunit [Modestobacter sp. DSM 44400]
MDSQPNGLEVATPGAAATDYAAVFWAMPTPYLVLAPDLVIADANPAYLATTGRSLDEIVGRPVFDAFPGNPKEVDADGGVGNVRASLERARDTGRTDVMPVQEYDFPDGVGGFTKRFWSLISIPVHDSAGRCRYLLQRAEDITGYVHQQGRAGDPEGQEAWRRRALDVQADLYARGVELQAARSAEAVTARRLAALARVSLQVSQAETVQELIRVVTEGGLVALGAHGGAVAVPAGDQQVRLVMSEGLRPAAGGGDGVLPWDAPYPGCVAARTGEFVVLPDRAATEAFAPEMREVIDSTGAECWVALPLESAGRRLGSLSVAWTAPRTVTDDELALLVAFAAQCAQALERIGTRETEQVAHAAVRGMAEALQRSLFTAPPEPDHLEIAVRYLPAASLAQVGGDWYDAFLLEDGRTALVIGDVTGHDSYAAAAMAQVRNVLRGVAHSRRDSPAAVLSALDRAMRDLEVGTLATAVLATVEQGRDEAAEGLRVLRWSNAGHPPPMMVETDGTVTVLECEPDLLLGVDPDVPRADHEAVLFPGATVLFYTDGLVERRDATLDQGIAWLSGALAQCAGLPLEEVGDRLLGELAGSVEDDVALLALRAHPEDRPRPPSAGRTRVPEGHTAT